jgi:YjbR
MTPNQFRKIALSLPDSIESEHMAHPDFRVGGKIFASLGAPDADWGMVKLTPEQQQAFCKLDPDCFQPCNGAWGRQGCTSVRLRSATTAVVRSALKLAQENVAAVHPRKRTAKAKSAPTMTKPKST